MKSDIMIDNFDIKIKKIFVKNKKTGEVGCIFYCSKKIEEIPDEPLLCNAFIESLIRNFDNMLKVLGVKDRKIIDTYIGDSFQLRSKFLKIKLNKKIDYYTLMIVDI